MTMDIADLNRTLLSTDGDLAATGGWDQPDYLFALRGDRVNPDLEYLLQVPRSAVDFLPTLVELGLRTGPDVLGLVLAAADDQMRAVVGITTAGTASVVVREHSTERAIVTPQLPERLGRHEVVVELLRRLMGHVPLMPRQVRLLQAAS